MALKADLALIAEITSPERFESFRKHIDPAWIEEALAATGTATLRKRRLPAEQVVWLVIGMSLLTDRSVENVVCSLDLALPGPRGDTVAPSSIPQARERVGSEPLAWLFKRCADVWANRSADAHRWHGLSVYGMDGSTLRIPDTQENRDAFGGGTAGAKRGASGYPMVRVVGLMVLRSHILFDAQLGPFKGSSEASLSRELVSRIPDQSVSAVDRGFLNAATLIPLARDGKQRHWLTRAKKNTKWRVLRRLGRGDELVEMEVSSSARKKDPTLPEKWVVRAIRYQRKGYLAQTILTSLLDPVEYPGAEVVALYHERWEIELGFAEVKTDMLDREETIRSKTPWGVYQEMWGLLIAYNLIRVEMEQVAAEAGVPPIRISFVMALHLIVDEWIFCGIAKPGTIPEKLYRLRRKVERFVLPPRRSGRVYPRAVKIKMSNYARKRPVTTAPRA
jgi:hypothetical protein